MNHNLELSKEVIDQIIFGMENQDNRFFLDLFHLKVVHAEDLADPDDSIEDNSDLIEIPEWKSVDGFNLMEKFVSDLKNPLARDELHRILQSGRGVFRHFKNRLKEYREVEKLWYLFKDREMKRRVVEWFNAVRESRGSRH